MAVEKQNIQAFLRQKAQQTEIDTTQIDPAVLKQLQQSRKYQEGSMPTETTAGEVTEADYRGALANVFRISDALHYPGERIVRDFMHDVQQYVQQQNAKAGEAVPSASTTAAVTTQFNGAAVVTKPSDVIPPPPAGPSAG